MNISVLLLLISIAFIDTSKPSGETEATTQYAQNLATTESSVERRWTPIFPKNHQKFLVTSNSIKVRNYSIHSNRPSYKIKLKTIPKAFKMAKGNGEEKWEGELGRSNYWKTSTTRRSVMKYRKYTIRPENTINLNKTKINNEKENGRKHEISLFTETRDAPDKDVSDESSEADEKRSNNNLKRMQSIKNTFSNALSENKKNIDKIKNVIYKSIKSNSERKEIKFNKKTKDGTELSSEEIEDRTEFIFLKPHNANLNIVNMVKDSDESGETATISEQSIGTREKRSVNVIEEENLGTTVSGFKFTGKVTSLSSDLIFRNINT